MAEDLSIGVSAHGHSHGNIRSRVEVESALQKMNDSHDDNHDSHVDHTVSHHFLVSLICNNWLPRYNCIFFAQNEIS